MSDLWWRNGKSSYVLPSDFITKMTSKLQGDSEIMCSWGPGSKQEIELVNLVSRSLAGTPCHCHEMNTLLQKTKTFGIKWSTLRFAAVSLTSWPSLTIHTDVEGCGHFADVHSLYEPNLNGCDCNHWQGNSKLHNLLLVSAYQFLGLPLGPWSSG
jgi:hypothetical protein